MNRSRRPDTFTPQVGPRQKAEPLSDHRYQDLLERAKAFFASAEVPAEEARLTAIAEIREQMRHYGLTADDLV